MTPADSSALSGSMQERGPQSLTGLLSQLLDDASALVRNEIRLAKAELLDSVSAEDVAEVRVAELALEASLLLLFYTAPGLECRADDPLQVFVGNGRSGIWEQQLGQATDCLIHRFDVATGECTAEVNAPLHH